MLSLLALFPLYIPTNEDLAAFRARESANKAKAAVEASRWAALSYEEKLMELRVREVRALEEIAKKTPTINVHTSLF